MSKENRPEEPNRFDALLIAAYGGDKKALKELNKDRIEKFVTDEQLKGYIDAMWSFDEDDHLVKDG